MTQLSKQQQNADHNTTQPTANSKDLKEKELNAITGGQATPQTQELELQNLGHTHLG